MFKAPLGAPLPSRVWGQTLANLGRKCAASTKQLGIDRNDEMVYILIVCLTVLVHANNNGPS
jgi:hypothetical protein